ncbi:phage head spike fiber domain-containing protein [Mesobacterium pallidum]|uniref:phage head spike fiber domain-containing protein n=1 Tax=Mesobacterium pallidum TaxID=2872037 RepID=UPI001EE2B41C|nr:hypothetical protein [Mesobacterium pallidum]
MRRRRSAGGAVSALLNNVPTSHVVEVGQSNLNSDGSNGQTPRAFTLGNSRILVGGRTGFHQLYQPGVNSHPMAPINDNGEDIAYWGPEARYLELERAAGRTERMVITKVTRGAANVAVNLDPLGSDNLFTELKAQCARAAALCPGGFLRQTMLMGIGNQDARTEAWTDAFLANLSAFWDAVLTEISPDMTLRLWRIRPHSKLNPAVVGDETYTASLRWKAEVREAQIDFANSHDGVEICDIDIEGDDLSITHPLPAVIETWAERLHALEMGTYTATYGNIYRAIPNQPDMVQELNATPGGTTQSARITLTGQARAVPISVPAGVQWRAIHTLHASNPDAVTQDWTTDDGVLHLYEDLELQGDNPALGGQHVDYTIDLGPAANVQLTFRIATFGELGMDFENGIFTAMGTPYADATDLVDHSSSGTRATTDATGLLSYTAGLRSNDHTFVDPDWVRRLTVDGDGYSNISLNSENIDAANYSKARVNSTLNATVAPDGATTADLLYADGTASSTHILTVSNTVTASTIYCVSRYFKADAFTRIRMNLTTANGWDNFRGISVNLLDGSFSNVGIGGLSSGVEYAGNGWWRIWVSGQTTTTTASVSIILENLAGATTFSGDNSSGVFAWGGMINVGHYPRAYAPTTGTIANVAAETISVASGLFPAIQSGAELTINIECEFVSQGPGLATGCTLLRSFDTGSDRFAIVHDSSADTGLLKVAGVSTAGGVKLVSTAADSYPYGQRHTIKISVAIKDNAMRVVIDGSTIGEDTTAWTAPDLSAETLDFAFTGQVSYKTVEIHETYWTEAQQQGWTA